LGTVHAVCSVRVWYCSAETNEEVVPMSKGLDKKKDEKKKPTKTLMEKRAEKKAKKAARK
jgi:hypothetical protein